MRWVQAGGSYFNLSHTILIEPAKDGPAGSLTVHFLEGIQRQYDPPASDSIRQEMDAVIRGQHDIEIGEPLKHTTSGTTGPGKPVRTRKRSR
jgi:hypothetical protein